MTIMKILKIMMIKLEIIPCTLEEKGRKRRCQILTTGVSILMTFSKKMLQMLNILKKYLIKKKPQSLADGVNDVIDL